MIATCPTVSLSSRSSRRLALRTTTRRALEVVDGRTCIGRICRKALFGMLADIYARHLPLSDVACLRAEKRSHKAGVGRTIDFHQSVFCIHDGYGCSGDS